MNCLASAPCGLCCHVVEFYELIHGITPTWVLLDFVGGPNTLINLMQCCRVFKHLLNACHMAERGTAQRISVRDSTTYIRGLSKWLGEGCRAIGFYLKVCDCTQDAVRDKARCLTL